MDRTPRLRSAFPDTPRHEPGSNLFKNGSTPSPSLRPPRKSVIRASSVVNAGLKSPPSNNLPPQIPLDFADGPTQRLYVLAVYMALLAWKMYDWASSSGYSQTEATWLFMKWSFLDGAFLGALPLLRIPWFEWSFITFLMLFLFHAATNFWLMFNISIPYSSIFFYLVSMFYDKELSLSDTRVSPDKIVHNSSIILGKQIINLLPEGSAILNPDLHAYCLDSSRTMVELPIQINQTEPESIELLRFDLDSDDTETIVIGAKQARKLRKEADKRHEKTDKNTPRVLMYPVSKKGLYRLQKVVDKSKLEVRRRSNDIAVVPCPQASLSATSTDKCTGELSGVLLHVTGVPPFKVKYSKRINQHQFSSITQTVQSDNDHVDGTVSDPKRPQMGWTQSKSLSIEINEALSQNGTWSYTIEEVEDGLNNKVTYEKDNFKKLQSAKHTQAVIVHKRPNIKFNGCDTEHFLRVAIEDPTFKMPLSVTPGSQIPSSDWPLGMHYTFTPQSGDDVPVVEGYSFEFKNGLDSPLINKAGRYDLVSIQSQFCQGEINEPSSCLVYNPSRPSLSLQTEEIFDKCAGRPIGTIVNFDFTGSPPFKVLYEVIEKGKGSTLKEQEFRGMRGQMTLRERSAGHYQYRILLIQDDVYEKVSVRSDENTFEQNIKPPAEAFFPGKPDSIKACLNSPASVDVKLLGEGPWDLEYELVHSGKRKKYAAHSESENLVIEIPPQTEGGKYTVVLTGVQDSSRCRTALKEERHIEIRPEQPRAAFGDINGKRFVEALHGKNVKLPIKLKGVAPWKVEIRNDAGYRAEHIFNNVNSELPTALAGVYEIVSVHDSCPGVVDPKADKFEIAWVKRPELHIRDDGVSEISVLTYRKAAVCQGEVDKLRVDLSGHSPYHLKYQISAEPIKGQKALTNKPVSVASNSVEIALDTSKAGQYTYTFNELSDDRYEHDRRHFAPIHVKQEVYALPTAQFASPGKIYGFCKDEDESPGVKETENIPITLVGVPPFSLEIAITHHGVSARPETLRIKDILSNTYSWALSRSSLGLGTHTIQIRGVKDSRNCEGLIESNPSTVRIQVASPPKIIPLDSRTDFCVGDHLAFSLSGQAPFDIFYTFHNRERKAHVNSHEFKRISDHAGDFTITAVQDSVAVQGGGKCKTRQDIRKTIHPYPTVRISHGKTLTTDIHEGGEVEIVFEFTGSPPFEFTYTRSENAKALKGRTPRVLETRHDSSNDFVKVIRASDEGTYEVVAIKDKHCAYTSPELAKVDSGKAQRLLT